MTSPPITTEVWGEGAGRRKDGDATDWVKALVGGGAAQTCLCSILLAEMKQSKLSDQ